MGEGEVEGQVAGILPVPHLLHELAAAVHAPRSALPQEGVLLLSHLQSHREACKCWQGTSKACAKKRQLLR